MISERLIWVAALVSIVVYACFERLRRSRRRRLPVAAPGPSADCKDEVSGPEAVVLSAMILAAIGFSFWCVYSAATRNTRVGGRPSGWRDMPHAHPDNYPR